MIKKIIIGLVVVIFITIQFFRPARNLSDNQVNNISTSYPVPEGVLAVLKAACYNCHSNKTEYPWYTNIQPIGWWINSHIVNGKRHINFSNFTSAPIAIQYRRFEGIINQVDQKEMPLESYTSLGMHKEAKLTDDQRQLIIDWARTQADTIRATYPADSLVVKRRRSAQPEN